MKALLTTAIAAAAAAGIIALAPAASALPANCQSQPWGFLGSQTRQLCDGPLRGDGSWWRHRVEGWPAHYANASSSCYGGSSYSSCTYYPGGFVPEQDTDDETYLVTPATVLPDEPGHIG